MPVPAMTEWWKNEMVTKKEEEEEEREWVLEAHTSPASVSSNVCS